MKSSIVKWGTKLHKCQKFIFMHNMGNRGTVLGHEYFMTKWLASYILEAPHPPKERFPLSNSAKKTTVLFWLIPACQPYVHTRLTNSCLFWVIVDHRWLLSLLCVEKNLSAIAVETELWGKCEET